MATVRGHVCRKVAGGSLSKVLTPRAVKMRAQVVSSLESILYVHGTHNANAMEISLAWVPMNYF